MLAFKGTHLKELDGAFERVEHDLASLMNTLDLDQAPPPQSLPAPSVERSLSVEREQSSLEKLKAKHHVNEAGPPVNTSALRLEMDHYEKMQDMAENGNILKWWKENSTALPILSTLARVVLAIPASSAKSERVFSKGTNTLTHKRHNLEPELVEDIIVIAENPDQA